MTSHNEIRINDLIRATKTFGWSETAVANLNAGKPAFWASCGNSNAPAGELLDAANRFASIEDAQEDLAAHFSRNGRDVADDHWLDYLLPLNRPAIMDLMRAYQRVGTFRTPAELMRRTERHEHSDALRVAAE